MPTPLVLNNPLVYLILTDGVAGDEVDISCHVRSVGITGSTDTIDTSTYCNPAGQADGNTTFEVAIDWIINDDTETVLEPFVGEEVTLWLRASAAATRQLTADIALTFDPSVTGTWEVGGVVESSTTHAAKSEPEWEDVPVAP